jgi:hypothetical protein
MRLDKEQYIMAYPNSGLPKTDLTNGKLSINFDLGTVALPDGTSTTLRNSLNKSKKEKVRSIMVYTNTWGYFVLGAGASQKIFKEQAGWTKFENISIEEFSWTTDYAQTPDEQTFIIIASTSATVPYEPLEAQSFAFKRTSETATTNTYAVHLERFCLPYSHQTLLLKETGSNDITYKIEVSSSKNSGWVELQGDTDIVGDANDVVQIFGAFRYIRVSVKSKVADTHGDLIIDWMVRE